MGGARHRNVYIAGPDLLAPVLRGAVPPVEGAPYRISPFFPPGPPDIFAAVVERIRAGAFVGRQTASSCWCALVSPTEIARLMEDLYNAAPEGPPRLVALRRFVSVLPRDCQFSLVALSV